MGYSFFAGELFLAIAVAVISLLISLLIAPFLRVASLKLGFYAEPNYRSSHIQKVANTGGILLFFSIAVPIYSLLDIYSSQNLLLLSISFAVLFVIGVLDDFFNVPVKYKLLGQLLPAALILLSLKSQNLIMPFLPASVDYPAAVTFSFWLIAVVGIINAYNFIDGIDGLAIGLGILSGLFFGVYFFTHGLYHLAFLGATLAGGLAGLLKYNLSRDKKIFLGDTGSLIIGGVVSLFILRLLETHGIRDLNFSSSLIFGLLFIPVSDLVRVVVVRLAGNKSPFKADRTHIHHVIMDSFLISHRRTSAIILLGQLIIFFVFLGYNELFDRGQILFSILMFGGYTLAVEVIKGKRKA